MLLNIQNKFLKSLIVIFPAIFCVDCLKPETIEMVFPTGFCGEFKMIEDRSLVGNIPLHGHARQVKFSRNGYARLSPDGIREFSAYHKEIFQYADGSAISVYDGIGPKPNRVPKISHFDGFAEGGYPGQPATSGIEGFVECKQ